MKHIFGPVPSRRFGHSLGVDIIPLKYCTLDCIYCQLGRTTHLTVTRKKYSPVKSVLNELKKVLKLKSNRAKIDCITFSGSGEPTLNSNIGKMISEIKKISNVPVVVLTNGTLLFRQDVKNDLLQADIVAPSLDGIPSFQKIDRPHKSLDIEKIIDGLEQFRKAYKGKIWLEILFVKDINDSQYEIESLKEAIAKIKPDKIHLNTVVRPSAEDYAKPLGRKKLLEIRKFFGKNCEIISDKIIKPHHCIEADNGESIQQKILQILPRRPLRLEDIIGVIKSNEGTILKELWLLERRKKIIKENGWWKMTPDTVGNNT